MPVIADLVGVALPPLLNAGQPQRAILVLLDARLAQRQNERAAGLNQAVFVLPRQALLVQLRIFQAQLVAHQPDQIGYADVLHPSRTTPYATASIRVKTDLNAGP